MAGVSQQTKIGEWAMHLNYTNINTAIAANNKIYVGAKSGLFIYDNSDNSVTSFSKLDGLSELNISALAYDNNLNMLVVGYNNGNVDIILENIVSNIPYIYMSSIVGSKKINNIFIYEEYAYLSCPFGVVVIDIPRMEIKETYYLSNDGTNTEVFSTYIFDENIYTESDVFLANKIVVGTSKGLFYANKYDNLLNYDNWEQNLPYSWSTKDNTKHNFDSTSITFVMGFDKKQNGGKQLTIAANIDYVTNPPPWPNTTQHSLFHLNTSMASQVPFFYVNMAVPGEIIHLDYDSSSENMLIVANDNNTEKVIILNDNLENILSINSKTILKKNQNISLVCGLFAEDYALNKNLFLGDGRLGLISAHKEDYSIDILDFIAPNGPAGVNIGAIFANKNQILFTHGAKNGQWNNLYNYQEISLFDNNYWSSSTELIDLGVFDAVSVCGNNNNVFYVGTWNSGLLEFEGSLLLNNYTPDNTSGALGSIAGTDNWARIGGVDFDENGALWMTSSQADRPLVKLYQDTWSNFLVPNLSNNIMSGKLLCASNNQKWIQLRDEGIIVAKENGKGIESKKLGIGNGLASNSVHCFEEDNNGEVWVGTSQGLSIFYFPNEIFNTNNYSAQYILIETEDGYVERLFENTEILDIKVDGGNRKWIGTKMNGVFLISDDGGQQILNFTKENSPLISNTVYDIDIMSSSGEVFFLTSGGLCSYRGNATESFNKFNAVSVFPNPVRPNYSGEIAISGLSDETNVKITNISGEIVFETTSNGGTATWSGKNFDGIKVSTGIYLFLCTSKDFEESIVKKIMIYN